MTGGIETKDLVMYYSERPSDTPDGGGKYNGQIVQDGLSNNLFNDVSEMDRTVGDVSMRKIYPAVTTNNTDLLMGATVFVSELPKDLNVSALLFSTGSFTDERSEAQNRVENYLAKGGQIAGVPMDTHPKGVSFVQVIMWPEEVESSTGATIVLASNEGKALEFLQYLKILDVETRIEAKVMGGQKVEYKIVTYTVNEPLKQEFIGLSAQQWYDGAKSTTIIRDTIVADTGKYYSSARLSSDAEVGEYTVNAESMFTQIIPSTQAETPIIDVNAAGESVVLVAGNDDTITVNYASVVVNTSQNLYIGSSAMPSSVSFTMQGQAITDQGGLLKNNLGTQVGTIDYQRGLIQWTASAPQGTMALNITFKPAVAPNQYYQSHAIPVTQNNQSSNWTGILIPIPAPGALSISYMSQGKFYTLKDDGAGQLKAINPSFGSGMVNYETGSWLLTTGALPDVDSVILLNWGTPIVTFIRSNLPIEKAGFEFDLEKDAILPGVTINWMLEGVAKTATSNSEGKFTGDATGHINYATGKGKIIPVKLPQKNTTFTITFSHGLQVEQTKSDVMPNASQKLTFTIGAGNPIQPNSVEITVPVKSDAYSDLSGVAVLRDVPVNATTGNLVSDGQVQGVINYTTGVCEVTPKLIAKKNITVYSPVVNHPPRLDVYQSA